MKSYILFVCFFYFIALSFAELEREIEIRTFNCSKFMDEESSINKYKWTTKHLNLVYYRLKGKISDDVVHFLLATIGKPSILVIRTSGRHDWLQVNCSKLLNSTDTSGAIHFANKTNVGILNNYGFQFSKLIEYNDADDRADLKYAEKHYNHSSNFWKIWPMEDFEWDNSFNLTGNNSKEFIFRVSKSDKLNFTQSGHIQIKFHFRQTTCRNDDLPRLMFTSNNTQFDFELNNLEPSFKYSRFAVELESIFDSKLSSKSILTNYIDDEHSPGVFSMKNWFVPFLKMSEAGYIQYKPVAYTKEKRERKSSTKVFDYGVNKVDGAGMNESDVIFYSFFGNCISGDTCSMNRENVSFGISKDKFYALTNFTSWTASIGTGKPPEDDLSLLVICILSFGLGIPFLLIIMGIIIVCVRRYRNSTTLSKYTSIN